MKHTTLIEIEKLKDLHLAEAGVNKSDKRQC